MAKGAYIGVGDVAKKVKKMYIGIGGVAHAVKKAYIGVNGVARLWWSGAGMYRVIINDTNSQSLYESKFNPPNSFSNLTNPTLGYYPDIVFDSVNRRFITAKSNSSEKKIYVLPEEGTTWTAYTYTLSSGYYRWDTLYYGMSTDPADGGLIFFGKKSNDYYYPIKIKIVNGSAEVSERSSVINNSNYPTRIKYLDNKYYFAGRGYQVTPLIYTTNVITGTPTYVSLENNSRVNNSYSKAGDNDLALYKYNNVWYASVRTYYGSSTKYGTAIFKSTDGSSFTKIYDWTPYNSGDSSNQDVLLFKEGLMIYNQPYATSPTFTSAGLWKIDVTASTITPSRLGNPFSYNSYRTIAHDGEKYIGTGTPTSQNSNKTAVQYSTNGTSWTVATTIDSIQVSHMACTVNN